MISKRLKYPNFIGNISQTNETVNQSNNNDVLQYIYLNRSLQRKEN